GAGIDEPLRFTAALTDGETLHCFRLACDDRPASLYFSEQPDAVIVASEPVDQGGDHWQAVPRGAFITVRRGTAPTVAPFAWAAGARAACAGRSARRHGAPRAMRPTSARSAARSSAPRAFPRAWRAAAHAREASGRGAPQPSSRLRDSGPG